MSIFRVYASKSNTIASGVYKNFNSSQNAVTDLFYGGGYTSSVFLRNAFSRFMIHFDLTELQQKINSKEINLDKITAFNLKLRNSIPQERVLDKNFEYDKLQRVIAASFDLICYPINKDWDEGRGYDLLEEEYIVKQKGNILISGYSNWESAKQNSAWDNPGIYTNPTASTSFYASQHFPIGNENINFNVTNIVKNWLSGGSENYGFAIGYRRDYELESGDTRYISSFYTNKTNTAWKPHLEIVYDQVIKDDRNQVTNNRSSKLFLYTYSANTAVNYHTGSTVTVDILAPNGTYVFTGLTPTHLEKGVYYVDVFMSGATKGEIYKDIWRNVSFNPLYDIQDITQSFYVQDNFYTGSVFQPTLNEYVLDIYGIPEGGVIYNDQLIKVFCDMRINYSVKAPQNNYILKYKIIMNNQEEVVPWTEFNQIVLDKKKTNYFTLDTSWLLHNQQYEILFSIEEMGSKMTLPKRISFKILRPF